MDRVQFTPSYIEVQFSISPRTEENAEILTAWIGELPFDSFCDTESGLNAYAPAPDFDPKALEERLASCNLFAIDYSIHRIADQNWNKTWEEYYFEPIVIGDQVLVRGSFHKNTPQVRWEIVIDPKMSFGSGHHATTQMMLELLLPLELQGKSVLDMGCGTAILAILAGMKNADRIEAIDIDEWAYKNSIENAHNNGQAHILVRQGGAELLPPLPSFDLILANINTNVLVADMHHYTNCLRPNGTLLLSGFYAFDAPKIEARAAELGLVKQTASSNKDWQAMHFHKPQN